MRRKRRPISRAGRAPGWTLTELLITAAVLMIVATLGTLATLGEGEAQARQKLQAASQTVVGGLEEARAAAVRAGQPCGLSLGPAGWQAPSGSLPPCRLQDPSLETGVEVSHNLPNPVRFSANGLVLDGGTVWLSNPGTPLVKCVVVSLPLGVTRVGREGPPGECVPEQVL
ncbi:MAG: GspH/FimT family pseudopilin [Cyanobacteriota bacterium]|nr:GspH/FimT family pseudopilin [Cyanobacteriota bacterium]